MKTIFISGASRGIGLAIAARFYKEDYQVAICARSAEKLAEVSALMPNIHTYMCDISDKAQVKKLAEELNTRYGALAILVNNGGVFQPGLLHKESDEVFENQINTNLNSAYYLSKGVLSPMIAAQAGTIVNMCSIASTKAYPNGGSYTISKFAMLGFGKALREELKEYNIRVVNVMPGAVLTDSWAGTDLPASRFIPVEDIAEIVWNACNVSMQTVVEDIVIRPALGDI
jgi:NAD(P)-dependent dehydrogenase (short-subunit alcohol dehydrogenase family)